jgi:hypothetical protein
MKDFWGWLRETTCWTSQCPVLNAGPGIIHPAKGIYPPYYTQYYHYPPADITTWGPDWITFMDDEDLKFKLSNAFFTPYIRKTIGSYGIGGAGGH